MSKNKPTQIETKESGADLQRPDLFCYHDHLSFLRHWVEYKKNIEKGFSLRGLAKEAGLGSGYLSMVFAGKRPLSQKALQKLKSKLGLNVQEMKYFHALVQLGVTDSQEQRISALAQMQRFLAYKNENPKELEVHQYLSHWYYVAIREMAVMEDFTPDPKWIQARLKTRVSLNEIEQGLAFLVENKYLEITHEGRAVMQEKNLECIGGVYKVALTQYHEEMLALAAQAITDTPSSEREIVSHTFALNAESFFEARQIITQTLDRLQALEKKSKGGTEIYHAELALFPLTKGIKK